MVAVGVMMFIGFIVDRTNLRQIVEDNAEDRKARIPSNKKFEWPLIALTSGYILVTVFMEATMGQMLFMYAESNPHIDLSPKQASTLVAVFWAAYTGGRLLATFASFILRPHLIVIISQACLSTGCGVLLLLIFSPGNSSWTIWLGTTLLGLGISPLYGSVCAWSFQYFHLEFIEMAVILTSACIGQTVPTYVVAPWVTNSITILPWVIGGQSLVLSIFMVVMIYWTHGATRIFKKDDEDDLVEDHLPEGLEAARDISVTV